MDSKTQTKKGMKISSKTRVKVAGLINDLHLLQSLPGCTTEIAKNYRLGSQFMKYLKELDVISTKDNTVLYVNPKNHSTEYILDYVMTRYQCEYGKEIKADTPSNLVTCDVELPAHLQPSYKEVVYKNEIRNLQSDLNRREAYIHTLKKELKKKEDIILSLTKKKSIFAKIKNLLS
jgi:hypothetical protein